MWLYTSSSRVGHGLQLELTALLIWLFIVWLSRRGSGLHSILRRLDSLPDGAYTTSRNWWALAGANKVFPWAGSFLLSFILARRLLSMQFWVGCVQPTFATGVSVSTRLVRGSNTPTLHSVTRSLSGRMLMTGLESHRRCLQRPDCGLVLVRQ